VSIGDALCFIERCSTVAPCTPDTRFQLAIRLSDGNELIGDMGMRFIADPSATVELGISLSTRHQRQGFAAEAMNAVPGFVFDDLRKHRVFGSVDPRNQPVIKRLEAVGMRREAHFRESLRVDGEWVDEVIYVILEQKRSVRRAAERHRG